MVRPVYALVKPDSTTLQMMQKLNEVQKIPIHEMQLWHNNVQLEEDKPLNHYGIISGSSLTLKRFKRTGACPCVACKRMDQKITVTVAWLAKKIQVECTLGEPVGSLKKAISKREGIAVAKQKLTFNGQTLEDHKLLASYKFGNDEESGTAGEEPVVHMFLDNGSPTMADKFRSLISLRSSRAPPEPVPVVVEHAHPPVQDTA